MLCWFFSSPAVEVDGDNIFKQNSLNLKDLTILPITRPALSTSFIEPRNQGIVECYAVQERDTSDLEAPKLSKPLSGIFFCPQLIAGRAQKN